MIQVYSLCIDLIDLYEDEHDSTLKNLAVKFAKWIETGIECKKRCIN